MKHVLLGVAAVLAAAAFLPAAAGAATVRGVVVGRSAHHTLLVATRTGRVVAIRGRAAIGSRVVGRQVVGHATHARIHGVVVTTKGSTIFVASNRHMVAIHEGRTLAAGGSSSSPAPGTIVTSTVTIGKSGQLDDQGEQDDGQDSSSSVPITATVDAVGSGTVTINVNGTDVTVDLPDGLTLPQSLVGQTVTINISIGQGDDQGDDNNDQGDSGDGDSGDGGSGG
ncbi:MAG: hypothetical protein ACRDLM_07220 [Gaiellaceae bacterium]